VVEEVEDEEVEDEEEVEDDEDVEDQEDDYDSDDDESFSDLVDDGVGDGWDDDEVKAPEID
jgi:hypothetical protein